MTPVTDAAGVRQWVRASSGMPGKFTLGPWQRIKDELLDIHAALLLVVGKEVEKRTTWFPTPTRAG